LPVVGGRQCLPHGHPGGVGSPGPDMTGIGAEVSVSESWARAAKEAWIWRTRWKPAFARKGKSSFLYDVNLPIREKDQSIATRIYGADGVDFYSPAASKTSTSLRPWAWTRPPSAWPRPSTSFSDDATKLGRPTGFRITSARFALRSGAGFLVGHSGEDHDHARPCQEKPAASHRYRTMKASSAVVLGPSRALLRPILGACFPNEAW